jgi:lysophospholipase L1-like esterase
MIHTQLRSAILLCALTALSAAQTVSVPVLVQRPPTASSDVDSATTPSASNSLAHPDWNLECRERVEADEGKRVDILFIGDSITQNWTGPDWGGERRGRHIWDRYYAGRYALNFGVGADTTENVLWRMDSMPIQTFHPKIAVLLIGVNNFQSNTAQEIADGTHAILDKTQRFYPGIKIILVSILPNRRSYQKMLDVNAITRTYADGRSIFYLDLVPLFVPVGDNWIGIGADHLHPNETGYEIWAKAMEPLLDKLLHYDASSPALINAPVGRR